MATYEAVPPTRKIVVTAHDTSSSAANFTIPHIDPSGDMSDTAVVTAYHDAAKALNDLTKNTLINISVVDTYEGLVEI